MASKKSRIKKNNDSPTKVAKYKHVLKKIKVYELQFTPKRGLEENSKTKVYSIKACKAHYRIIKDYPHAKTIPKSPKR